ncbi:MAG: hypothetical protein OEL53_14315 [Rhodospirillales bacterium]|nr:hypothetical protein [Rhodospirillales bacterium]
MSQEKDDEVINTTFMELMVFLLFISLLTVSEAYTLAQSGEKPPPPPPPQTQTQVQTQTQTPTSPPQPPTPVTKNGVTVTPSPGIASCFIETSNEKDPRNIVKFTFNDDDTLRISSNLAGNQWKWSPYFNASYQPKQQFGIRLQSVEELLSLPNLAKMSQDEFKNRLRKIHQETATVSNNNNIKEHCVVYVWANDNVERYAKHQDYLKDIEKYVLFYTPRGRKGLTEEIATYLQKSSPARQKSAEESPPPSQDQGDAASSG